MLFQDKRKSNIRLPQATKTRMVSLSLALCLSVATFSGISVAADADAFSIINSQGAAEASTASRPYTKEELLNAKPYDFMVPAQQPQGDVMTLDAADYATGKPGFDKEGRPEGLKNSEAGPATETPQIDAVEEPFTTGTGYPGPFTRYTNFDSYRGP